MPVKIQYIILFNTGKYWGGQRNFVRQWFKSHMYSSKKMAERAAKHVMNRRITWYNNTELKSFEILEVNLFLIGK